MQNEEKMLTIDDAYDVTFDFLEKIYYETRSEEILTIFCDMQLMSDGKSVDPAISQDWGEAVDKLFTQKPDVHQKFELAGEKFTIKDAYEAMINFLETYHYFNEIVDMLGSMRSSIDGMPADSKMWTSWVESVDKILSENIRVRPLFISSLCGVRVLTLYNAFYVFVSFLHEYCRKMGLNGILPVIDQVISSDLVQAISPAIKSDWNESVYLALSQDPKERQNFELTGRRIDEEEAYNAAIIFLDKYRNKFNPDEISIIIDDMKVPVAIPKGDSPIWQLWSNSVNKALNHNPCIAPLFFLPDTNDLIVDDAYLAVFYYLNKAYEATKSDAVETIFNAMCFSENEEPVDQAVQDDWVEAVHKTLDKNTQGQKTSDVSGINLSIKKAYAIMVNFLDIYGHRVNSSYIIAMLDGMKFVENGTTADPVVWSRWLESADEALSKKSWRRPFGYIFSNAMVPENLKEKQWK